MAGGRRVGLLYGTMSGMLEQYVAAAAAGTDLTVDEAQACADAVFATAATEVDQVAALLRALAEKGEAVAEVVGFARAILERAHSGTGSDSRHRRGPGRYRWQRVGAVQRFHRGVVRGSCRRHQGGKARQPRVAPAQRQHGLSGCPRHRLRAGPGDDGRLLPGVAAGVLLCPRVASGHGRGGAGAPTGGTAHHLQLGGPAVQSGAAAVSAHGGQQRGRRGNAHRGAAAAWPAPGAGGLRCARHRRPLHLGAHRGVRAQRRKRYGAIPSGRSSSALPRLLTSGFRRGAAPTMRSPSPSWYGPSKPVTRGRRWPT